MAKEFKARVSKKERKTIDFSSKLSRDLLKLADQKLFEGARLEEFPLKDIEVKEQVRTKFNDKSIRDLAENIRTNGLIQPLVLHRSEGVLHSHLWRAPLSRHEYPARHEDLSLFYFWKTKAPKN